MPLTYSSYKDRGAWGGGKNAQANERNWMKGMESTIYAFFLNGVKLLVKLNN